MTKPYKGQDYYDPCHLGHNFAAVERCIGLRDRIGFFRTNVLKYRLRAGRKPGESIEKDIGKAQEYEPLLSDSIDEYRQIVRGLDRVRLEEFIESDDLLSCVIKRMRAIEADERLAESEDSLGRMQEKGFSG